MANSAGVRRLAVAVLQRAAFDAAGLIDTSTWGKSVALRAERAEWIREESYDWLTTPSAALALWADVAGIAMRDVIDGADAAVEYARKRAEVMAKRRSSTTWAAKG